MIKNNELGIFIATFLIFLWQANALVAGQYETTIEVGGNREIEWSPDEEKEYDSSTLLSKANDFKAAFDALKKADPAAKIFMVAGGISIDRIQELTIMPSGTLILVEYLQSRKIKTKVVKVEDISELGQR